jgi:hypothetical protein
VLLRTAVLFMLFSFLLIQGTKLSAQVSHLRPCPSDTKVRWENCHGSITFPDGTKYVGEFRNNNYDGLGSLTYPDGSKYDGEFRNNNRDGRGIYRSNDGFKYIGSHGPAASACRD